MIGELPLTEVLSLPLEVFEHDYMAIKILSPEVSARIAAGEVVERPASVVKELLENSLDAGSTRIRIETTEGGIESISVIDNGRGIPEVDVPLVFKRFATSKVETAEDLEAIETLGFRGEAMYSISAVSEVELVTGVDNESTGSRLVARDGEIVEQSFIAVNPGTKVKVTRLFRNFPARRKFLRTRSAESGRIKTLVHRYSMIRPDVAFELIQEKSRPFSTTGSNDIRNVMSSVYGNETANQMLQVKLDEVLRDWRGPVVMGIIGTPAQTRANRSHINIFINGRWIQSKTVSYAFEQAYHGFMADRRFPMGALDIHIPVEDVDVNVHPAKTEVRFRKESDLFGSVQHAVRNTLLQLAPVPSASPRGNSQRQFNQDHVPATHSTFWPTSIGSIPKSENPNSDNTIIRPGHLEVVDYADSVANRQSHTPHGTLPVLRVLGQIKNTYIVAEGPEGAYLIDQHAAHERVVFEQVKERSRKSALVSQTLLEPRLIRLDQNQVAILEENTEIFEVLGMDIEPFGPEIFRIRSVPSVLLDADPAAALIEVLDVLGDGLSFESWEEKAAYSVACHGAIRAGKSLSMKEMEALTRQLELCEQPNSCPHGRPTIIHLSIKQLERDFGR